MNPANRDSTERGSLQGKAPVLFGKIEHPPLWEEAKPKIVKKPGQTETDIKIDRLNNLLIIEKRVKERNLRWAYKKIDCNERFVLQQKIALNKILKTVGEKVRKYQLRFMEGMFSAAEGDIDFEELLKSSQRNSISNDSRFSTVWRNRASTGGFGMKISPKDKSRLTAGAFADQSSHLDSFVQQILERASKEKSGPSHSRISEEDGSSFLGTGTRRSNTEADDVPITITHHLPTEEDDFPTKVEINAYNKKADKFEKLMGNRMEKNTKKIERYLILERVFVQMARIFASIRYKSTALAFGRIIAFIQGNEKRIMVLHSISQTIEKRSLIIALKSSYESLKAFSAEKLKEQEQLKHKQLKKEKLANACKKLSELFNGWRKSRQEISIRAICLCIIEVRLAQKLIEDAGFFYDHSGEGYYGALLETIGDLNKPVAESLEPFIDTFPPNRYLCRLAMLSHILDSIFSSRDAAIITSAFFAMKDNYEEQIDKMNIASGLSNLLQRVFQKKGIALILEAMRERQLYYQASSSSDKESRSLAAYLEPRQQLVNSKVSESLLSRVEHLNTLLSNLVKCRLVDSMAELEQTYYSREFMSNFFGTCLELRKRKFFEDLSKAIVQMSKNVHNNVDLLAENEYELLDRLGEGLDEQHSENAEELENGSNKNDFYPNKSFYEQKPDVKITPQYAALLQPLIMMVFRKKNASFNLIRQAVRRNIPSRDHLMKLVLLRLVESRLRNGLACIANVVENEEDLPVLVGEHIEIITDQDNQPVASNTSNANDNDSRIEANTSRASVGKQEPQEVLRPQIFESQESSLKRSRVQLKRSQIAAHPSYQEALDRLIEKKSYPGIEYDVEEILEKRKLYLINAHDGAFDDFLLKRKMDTLGKKPVVQNNEKKEKESSTKNQKIQNSDGKYLSRAEISLDTATFGQTKTMQTFGSTRKDLKQEIPEENNHPQKSNKIIKVMKDASSQKRDTRDESIQTQAQVLKKDQPTQTVHTSDNPRRASTCYTLVPPRQEREPDSRHTRDIEIRGLGDSAIQYYRPTREYQTNVLQEEYKQPTSRELRSRRSGYSYYDYKPRVVYSTILSDEDAFGEDAYFKMMTSTSTYGCRKHHLSNYPTLTSTNGFAASSALHKTNSRSAAFLSTYTPDPKYTLPTPPSLHHPSLHHHSHHHCHPHCPHP